MAKKAPPAPPPVRGAPKQAPRAVSASSRKSSSQLLWFTVIVALLLPWILPSMIVVFVGIIPSLISLIMDRSPFKYGALTVAALNLAGVVPYLVKLWSKSQSMENALSVVIDVFALAVMYGAAAFGWMIFLTIPSFVASIFMVISQRRIAALRDIQRKIIEEWGESIARADASQGKS